MISEGLPRANCSAIFPSLDEEARSYNHRLVFEPNEYAGKLRRQLRAEEGEDTVANRLPGFLSVLRAPLRGVQRCLGLRDQFLALSPFRLSRRFLLAGPGITSLLLALQRRSRLAALRREWSGIWLSD